MLEIIYSCIESIGDDSTALSIAKSKITETLMKIIETNK